MVKVMPTVLATINKVIEASCVYYGKDQKVICLIIAFEIQPQSIMWAITTKKN